MLWLGIVVCAIREGLDISANLAQGASGSVFNTRRIIL